MGERWPSISGRRLAAIIVRLCGEPERRSGSHRVFRSPRTGRTFVFAYHDRESVHGSQVRRILTTDVGLTADEARREL
jgi:predicted RNA binding protein YcfA (HicA-like mRNA interferase family)